jgi:hypothetical protein
MQSLQAADESQHWRIPEEQFNREAEKPRSAHKRRVENTNEHAPDTSPLSDMSLDDDLTKLLNETSIDEGGRVCFYASTSFYHIEAGGVKDRPDLTQVWENVKANLDSKEIILEEYKTIGTGCDGFGD